MKIWHQCTSDLSAATAFKENMQRHIEKVMDPGDVVAIHGMPKGTFGSGGAVKAMEAPYLEFLCEIFFCEAALTAQREGYDAMTIGCYMDTGLELARSLVDIPVLSVTETSVMAASMLGKAYGVVTVEPYMAETFERKAKLYGNPERLATIVATQPPISMGEMEQPALADLAKEKFLSFCQKAIDREAEVLIPGEGTLSEFAYSHEITACGAVRQNDVCAKANQRLTGKPEKLPKAGRAAAAGNARLSLYAGPYRGRFHIKENRQAATFQRTRAAALPAWA